MTGENAGGGVAHTAAAQQRGQIGAEHVRIIRRFFERLPGFVDHETREAAEAQLAELACELKPEERRQVADRLAVMLDQDGELSDGDRARRRYLIVGKQQTDGMSDIRGRLDPEAARYSTRCSPNGPHRACATPTRTMHRRGRFG